MGAYALFDFDGTCIRGDSIIAFLKYSYAHGKISFRTLVKAGAVGIGYTMKRISSERSKEIAYAFLQGKSLSEIEAYGERFCRECLVPRLRPEAVETIRSMHHQGYHILLVSASATFYLKHLLSVLPIDGVLGTELQLDAQGCYNGKLLGRSCRDMEKVARIKEYEKMSGLTMDEEKSAAFGDTISDYPMMRLCGRRVGINPKRRLKKRLGKDTKGEIRKWTEPTK